MSGPGEMRLYDIDEPPVESTKHARAKPGTGDAGVVRMPIDQGLGHVAVSESGELTTVDLDERAMRATRADRLAELVLAALVRAQDAAAQRRSDAIREQVRGLRGSRR